jgi:chromosome partitioning protein
MEKKLLGINEISQLAKVSPSAIINWRKRDTNFPKPIEELKSGPIFEFNQIKKYLKRKNIPMATIISTINLKGGVGKTTTTIALAEFLSAEKNQKVLVIDLDPQTNATVLLLGEDRWKELNEKELTLARLFKDALDPDYPKFNIEKTLQKNVSNVRDVVNVDLLPSSLDLIDIQDRIASAPQGRFYSQNPTDILKRAIKSIEGNYDYIIIDCPPNLGIITLNGLRISNGYIIPTIPDYLSTYGIPQIHQRVSEFAENILEDIIPFGIIATMYREQSTVHRNILKQLGRSKEAPLFDTVIPLSNQISASADITDYNNTLRQKYGYQGNHQTYLNLTNELIDKVTYELQK